MRARTAGQLHARLQCTLVLVPDSELLAPSRSATPCSHRAELQATQRQPSIVLHSTPPCSVTRLPCLVSDFFYQSPRVCCPAVPAEQKARWRDTEDALDQAEADIERERANLEAMALTNAAYEQMLCFKDQLLGALQHAEQVRHLFSR